MWVSKNPSHLQTCLGRRVEHERNKIVLNRARPRLKLQDRIDERAHFTGRIRQEVAPAVGGRMVERRDLLLHCEP